MIKDKHITKLEKLKELMANGDWDRAIKLASTFPRLGAHKGAIQRARSAKLSPALYRGMRYDLEKIQLEGIKALKERYG